MRINPQIPAAGSAEINQVGDSQTSAGKNVSAAISGEPRDTVQLSSAQSTVRQLVSQASQLPEVRQQKVDSLRSAIQSGQYQPSNTAVAGAIVNEQFGSASKA